jgi:hypothetical protein
MVTLPPWPVSTDFGTLLLLLLLLLREQFKFNADCYTKTVSGHLSKVVCAEKNCGGNERES